MRWLTFVTGALALSLAACGEVSEQLGTAELELGVDESDGEGFRLVPSGSDATLVSGSQGGFHVWTTPRFRGVTGEVILERQARRVFDGRLVLRASPLFLEIPDDASDTWWSMEKAFPSFMCPSPVGVSVIDEEIEFFFRLLNEDEELLAEASLILVPRCTNSEGQEIKEWCERICSG